MERDLPPPNWRDLPVVRVLGHPAVFGLILLGWVTSVTSLIVGVLRQDGSDVVAQALMMIVISFGVLVGWRMFRARRDQVRPGSGGSVRAE